jgi:predicted RNA binding protein YcfA (HicA-like mRNA interferase family)
MNVQMLHGLPFVRVSIRPHGQGAVLEPVLIDMGSRGTVLSADRPLTLGVHESPDELPYRCVFSVYEIGKAPMSSTEVLRRLKADGWSEVASRGSHVQLKHFSKRGRVTVPHPKKDLPIGTPRSIERQSGVKLT